MLWFPREFSRHSASVPLTRTPNSIASLTSGKLKSSQILLYTCFTKRLTTTGKSTCSQRPDSHVIRPPLKVSLLLFFWKSAPMGMSMFGDATLRSTCRCSSRCTAVLNKSIISVVAASRRMRVMQDVSWDSGDETLQTFYMLFLRPISKRESYWALISFFSIIIFQASRADITKLSHPPHSSIPLPIFRNSKSFSTCLSHIFQSFLVVITNYNLSPRSTNKLLSK